MHHADHSSARCCASRIVNSTTGSPKGCLRLNDSTVNSLVPVGAAASVTAFEMFELLLGFMRLSPPLAVAEDTWFVATLVEVEEEEDDDDEEKDEAALTAGAAEGEGAGAGANEADGEANEVRDEEADKDEEEYEGDEAETERARCAESVTSSVVVVVTVEVAVVAETELECGTAPPLISCSVFVTCCTCMRCRGSLPSSTSDVVVHKNISLNRKM